MKETNLYIGIDPSINSTGVCVMSGDEFSLYNIKSKRTQKEKKLYDAVGGRAGAPVVVMYDYSDHNIYNKKDANRDQHMFELVKTKNAINITKEIYNIIDKEARCISGSDNTATAYVCIEAPAFGTGGKTVSLVDLCGLNYLIREMILSLPEKCVNIKEVKLICSVPSEIKKYATGRGDADKDIMLYCFSLLEPAVAEAYGFMKMDDMADAYFMCRYAEYIYNKENDKRINKCDNSAGVCFDAEMKSKINYAACMKNKKHNTIYKGNKSIWDDDMLSFAESLMQ